MLAALALAVLRACKSTTPQFAVSIQPDNPRTYTFTNPSPQYHRGHPQGVAIGLQTFNALYSVNTHLIMAASVVIPPVLLFFFAQRQFIQDIVLTGVKG